MVGVVKDITLQGILLTLAFACLVAAPLTISIAHTEIGIDEYWSGVYGWAIVHWFSIQLGVFSAALVALAIALSSIAFNLPRWFEVRDTLWWRWMQISRFVQNRYIWLFFLGFLIWLYAGGAQLILEMTIRALRLSDVLQTEGNMSGGMGGADPHYDRLRNLLLGLAAMFGIPFFLLRAWIAERTTRNAEQGHMTERIATAVKLLGEEKSVKRRASPQFLASDVMHVEAAISTSRKGRARLVVGGDREATPPSKSETIEVTEPNLEVRIGAIYALERISQDSPRDHWQVMEILTAYLRENAKNWKVEPPDLRIPLEADAEERERRFREHYERSGAWRRWLDSQPDLRVDLQAVVTVVSRRGAARRLAERRQSNQLDLRAVRLVRPDFVVPQHPCDMRAAKLSGAGLIGADLRWADLSGANLSEADLSGADLIRARLIGADMIATNLNRARLSGANFNRANLSRANFISSDLKNADFISAVAVGANFNGADLIRATLNGVNLTGANLSQADLSEADLGRARLSVADLRWATLRGANLSGADLSGADVTEADLKGASLAGANLSENSLLASARGLRQALRLDTARLPAGWSVVRNTIEEAWDIMTPDGPYFDVAPDEGGIDAI